MPEGIRRFVLRGIMRYNEDGHIHMDFHKSANMTIDYIAGKYGLDAIHEIFFRVGRNVYKDIREHLERGDTGELVKYWGHFFRRENADFEIVEDGDSVTLIVRRCPAVAHLQAHGIPVSPHFCDQTEHVNRGMTDGTPYVIDTTITGEGSCRQVLRRRS